MPCFDALGAAEDNELRTVVTRFACEMLTRMEEHGEPIPEYIQEWWNRHKEMDEILGRRPQ